MKKKRFNGDMIAGVVLAIFAIVYYSQTFGIRQTTLISISSAAVPRICAYVMFVLSILLFAQGVRALRASNAALEKAGPVTEEQAAAAAEKAQNGRKQFFAALVAFALLFIGMLLMTKVGFVVGMAVYLFGSFLSMSLYEKRRYWLFVLLAIVVPIVIYLVFTQAFSLRLPAGIFDIGGGIL